MQKLKIACEKNEKANSLMSAMDINVEGFDACLKELDDRFLVIRKSILQMVEELHNISTVKSKGVGLMKLHDAVRTTTTNMMNLIKVHVLSDDDDLEEMPTVDELIELKGKAKLLDAILGAYIYRKLDDETCNAIVNKLKLRTNDIADPKEMLKVIKTKLININDVPASGGDNSANNRYQQQSAKPQRASVSAVHSRPEKLCVICGKSNHVGFQCRSLTSLKDISARFNLCKEKKICRNCLVAPAGKCNCYKTKKSQCKHAGCTFLHHSLLHDDNWKPKTKDISQASVNHVQVSHMSANRGTTRVAVLPTVILKVISSEGRSIMARAFLDSGATRPLVSKSFVKRLKAKTLPTHALVAGYSGDEKETVVEKLSVTLKPHFPSDFVLKMEDNPQDNQDRCLLVTESLG